MVTAIVLIKTDDISDEMRLQEGIFETETMIAFRAYSWQEMKAGFELGLD